MEGEKRPWMFKTPAQTLGNLELASPFLFPFICSKSKLAGVRVRELIAYAWGRLLDWG